MCIFCPFFGVWSVRFFKGALGSFRSSSPVDLFLQFFLCKPLISSDGSPMTNSQRCIFHHLWRDRCCCSVVEAMQLCLLLIVHVPEKEHGFWILWSDLKLLKWNPSITLASYYWILLNMDGGLYSDWITQDTERIVQHIFLFEHVEP